MTQDSGSDDSTVVQAATCTIVERQIGSATVVAVTGTVDMVTSPQLEAALTSAIGRTPPAIVVDLSDVDFLASTGMGVLVAAHDGLPAGTRFAVVADGPATSRPLDVIGFAGILGVCPTLDEALRTVTT